MSEGTVSLAVKGETLLLHPQRAVLWPRCRTIIVADTHFGKSSFFARHGIAVPAGSDESDRQRLTHLIESTDARRLIILGDFLHAPLSPHSADSADLQCWAEQLASFLEIHVVAGNHDIGPRSPVCRLSIGGILTGWTRRFVSFTMHSARRQPRLRLPSP
jgi:metallophosphoesterase superfamily enzyme